MSGTIVSGSGEVVAISVPRMNEGEVKADVDENLLVGLSASPLCRYAARSEFRTMGDASVLIGYDVELV